MNSLTKKEKELLIEIFRTAMIRATFGGVGNTKNIASLAEKLGICIKNEEAK